MATKKAATIAMVEEVADELAEVSSRPPEQVFGGDVDSITRVMQDMVRDIDVDMLTSDVRERKQVVRKIGSAVARSGSNMLESGQRESWLDLPQATQAEVATRVIESVEESAYKLADTLDPPSPRVPSAHIEVQVNLGESSFSLVFDLPPSELRPIHPPCSRINQPSLVSSLTTESDV